MIQVKEDAKQLENQFSLRLKSFEGQNQDMSFVNGQSIGKIRELEDECNNLRRQLELARSGKDGSVNAQRVLDGDQRKVSFSNQSKAPGFELSHTLPGENNDPNTGCACGRSQFGAYQSQQDVWAEELRRADDRCNKFKQDISEMQRINSDMENDIFLLNEKVSLRDQEINRLNVVSAGSSSFPAIRENFDQKQTEEKIISQERQIEFINRQN